MSCREILCHWLDYTKRAVRDMPVVAAKSDIGWWSYGFGAGLSGEDRDSNAAYQ